LLAVVFAAAAAAKLWDREGTRDAVVGFGAPERAAAPLALLLPVAELAVAALLLPDATALAGALGAATLLLVLSAAIALNLARGRAPDCHCFGQLHSAPAGPMTLVRNGALAAVAAFVIGGSLNGTEPAVAAAALVLFAAGCAAFVSLLRSYGRLLLRVEELEQALAGGGPEFGLELGTPAPMFTARDIAGAEVTLDDLLAPGPPLLLIFASAECGPCRALLPDVAAWRSEHAGRLTVAVATDGAPEEVSPEAEALGLEHMLVDDGAELYRSFEANGTPSAVLIAPDGAIASRVAAGPDAIEALMADVLDAPGVPIGAPVPPVELPSLDGERLSLADLRGRNTLVLFWDPQCAYCRGMHEDLLAWESTANGSAPQLVVVASGDEEAIRSEGFRSKVLLDEDFAAGAEFGVSGTPMAVLVDADGHVASGVAAGAEAVLALAEPASAGAAGRP